jgi:hypothetical protein
MSIPAHIARLRAVVGHDLLLLPSVSVLPVDQAARLLLVRHAGHDDGWGVLGGAVEVGESCPSLSDRVSLARRPVKVRRQRSSPPREISCAAITLRWISLVPSPTIISGASRK